MGSPPLTRGKAVVVCVPDVRLRITPAYAGKRAFQLVDLAGAGDHPRLRGEKPATAALKRSRQGSPPLTRGKVFFLPLFLAGRRITPAYAGKSVCTPDFSTYIEDHPRLRGEKSHRRTARSFRAGSPPLTRGKVRTILNRSQLTRITPAYAGKRKIWAPETSHRKDHPRLRGEKALRHAFVSFFWDHPRLRGEKKRIKNGFVVMSGSPPLTRGKGINKRWNVRIDGITPAYAGKRLNTVAKRSHIICSCPVFYCISFDILPPPFNCSYSLLVISQSFSARCGFIFCQPKYLASVVSW